SSPASVLGYSDGHMAVSRGCLKVGVGFYITICGRKVDTLSMGIGPRANIFDAEMLALAKCLTKAVRIASTNMINHIHLFCDNQATIRTIHDPSKHPAQYASLIFLRALNLFLEGHPDRHVHVTWVPGHAGIKGNDVADSLAKGGANVPPTPLFNRTITWVRTHATQHASRSWNQAWIAHVQKRPDSGWYIPRPPALKLHPIFNSTFLSRDVTSRLVQLISGHGFYGEYRNRFHPDIDPRCSCGESVETIAHALAFCPRQEDKRHILRKCSPTINERELFGTLAGLMAVSKFIAKSGIGKLGSPPATAQIL
ncbi:putative reverse transcriptase from mobile element jockey protein, partial [Rhizoctonia solani 123E]